MYVKWATSVQSVRDQNIMSWSLIAIPKKDFLFQRLSAKRVLTFIQSLIFSAMTITTTEPKAAPETLGTSVITVKQGEEGLAPLLTLVSTSAPPSSLWGTGRSCSPTKRLTQLTGTNATPGFPYGTTRRSHRNLTPGKQRTETADKGARVWAVLSGAYCFWISTRASGDRDPQTSPPVAAQRLHNRLALIPRAVRVSHKEGDHLGIMPHFLPAGNRTTVQRVERLAGGTLRGEKQKYTQLASSSHLAKQRWQVQTFYLRGSLQSSVSANSGKAGQGDWTSFRALSDISLLCPLSSSLSFENC